MKQFTAYHVVAFFGVLFLILCADGIMDAASPAGFTAISLATIGAASLLWRHGETVLYHHNKPHMRRRRWAMRDDPAKLDGKPEDGRAA